MNTTHSNRAALVIYTTLVALTLAAVGAGAVVAHGASASAPAGGPIVKVDGDAVRGVAVAGGYAARTRDSYRGDATAEPRLSPPTASTPRRHR